jgi:phospholipid transport system transporter-binding protein
MTAPAFESTGPGRFRVSGALDYASVGRVERLARPLLGAAPEAVVDLGGVQTANSAALALLLEWVDQARQGRRRVRFTGVPAAVLEIAKVSNVADLLPLAGNGR